MNRTDLFYVIRDILEINCHYQVRSGPAQKIVDAVIKAIVNGLLKDGEVKIQGFGIFRVRTRKARRSACVYHYHQVGDARNTQINLIPARKYVHFQPSKLILRELNNPDGHSDLQPTDEQAS